MSDCFMYLCTITHSEEKGWKNKTQNLCKLYKYCSSVEIQQSPAVSCCSSDDDSELSDNEKERLPKGEEGLLNGATDGMIINGSMSRDGESLLPSIFLSKPYSKTCHYLFMLAYVDVSDLILLLVQNSELTKQDYTTSAK